MFFRTISLASGKNENSYKEKDDKYKDYKILTETNEIFDKVIENLDKEFIFKKNKLVKNSEWSWISFTQILIPLII